MRLVIITLLRKSSTLDSQSHRCVVDYSTVNPCIFGESLWFCLHLSVFG